jgi:uncharacterized protein (DUF362 family)
MTESCVIPGEDRTVDQHRVALFRATGTLEDTVRAALKEAGILDIVSSCTRVAIKPNLTYPYHRPGITTSPAVLAATVRVLLERTRYLAIVETDGGYGAWTASEAFVAHGIVALGRQYGLEVVNLNDERREMIRFRSRFREYELPLPTRLLHATDVFITMPVPKIHCMTGISLAYKNQWGCVPDTMRLRRHYIFDDAIVAIDNALRPVVLADGTYFLDKNGPMEGVPVRMDLIIAASSAGAFDRYTTELMGCDWRRVGHLRRAAEAGRMPRNLSEIMSNVNPEESRRHVFVLNRTLRNYIALTGFKSRFLTWLGYESWFGRVALHRLLYLVAGRPVKPQA